MTNLRLERKWSMPHPTGDAMRLPWIAEAEAMIRQQTQVTVTLAVQVARLQTITGVHLLTATAVVAETRPLRGAATAEEIISYAGLDLAPYDSGTSVRGARHIKGNARLRQAVYMATPLIHEHDFDLE